MKQEHDEKILLKDSKQKKSIYILPELQDHILSFLSYKDLIDCDLVDESNLLDVLKRDYKVKSVPECFVRQQRKKKEIIHLPIPLYEQWLPHLSFRDQQYLFINEEILEKYKEKWNWELLSKNPCLNETLIEKYKEKWDWECLSENPCLNEKIIEKYIDKWNWYWLSKNPCLNEKIIEKYIDKWDWVRLSLNPCLNEKIIEKYIDKLSKEVLLNYFPHLKYKFE